MNLFLVQISDAERSDATFTIALNVSHAAFTIAFRNVSITTSAIIPGEDDLFVTRTICYAIINHNRDHQPFWKVIVTQTTAISWFDLWTYRKVQRMIDSPVRAKWWKDFR